MFHSKEYWLDRLTSGKIANRKPGGWKQRKLEDMKIEMADFKNANDLCYEITSCLSLYDLDHEFAFVMRHKHYKNLSVQNIQNLYVSCVDNHFYRSLLFLLNSHPDIPITYDLDYEFTYSQHDNPFLQDDLIMLDIALAFNPQFDTTGQLIEDVLTAPNTSYVDIVDSFLDIGDFLIQKGMLINLLQHKYGYKRKEKKIGKISFYV